MTNVPPENREPRPRLLSVLTLLGTAAVVVALVLASMELNRTASRVTALRSEARSLTVRNQALARASDSLENETAGLRQALTAAREAIAAYHAGDYLGAVALYDRVLRGDSSNAYLLNLKAYSLFKAGRLAEALRSQELSVRADSSYAWAYFDLARFQCAAKQWSAARMSLQRLLRIAPAMRTTVERDGEFQRLCRTIAP